MLYTQDMKKITIKKTLLMIGKALFFMMGLFVKAVGFFTHNAIDYQTSLSREKERIRMQAENKRKDS